MIHQSINVSTCHQYLVVERDANGTRPGCGQRFREGPGGGPMDQQLSPVFMTTVTAGDEVGLQIIQR